MSVTDPIADMLTRIRNATIAGHDTVIVPASRTKLSIAKILKEENFVKDYEVTRGGPHRGIRILLSYPKRGQSALTGLRRVSRPGLRVYVHRREIPRVYGGLGIAILSTPQGLMTGQQAWKKNLGGEVLAYVW
ncbi:MAG: 30S ribosomal protein S8 [Chloroflexi bacterium]|nr:30S ribosomal protein S8 [Chloroflexota bacterium]